MTIRLVYCIFRVTLDLPSIWFHPNTQWSLTAPGHMVNSPRETVGLIDFYAHQTFNISFAAKPSILQRKNIPGLYTVDFLWKYITEICWKEPGTVLIDLPYRWMVLCQLPSASFPWNCGCHAKHVCHSGAHWTMMLSIMRQYKVWFISAFPMFFRNVVLYM